MREYARLRAARTSGPEVDRIVEALVNGLSADPRAFIGQAPGSLTDAEVDRAEFAGLFLRYRDELLPAFETFRPDDEAYSPLSFFFNFSHNVLKGTVVDALLRGRAWEVSFNDLLSALARYDAQDKARRELATT